MSIRDEILTWVQGTLSRRQDFLGGLPPCPYAAEAVLRNQVDISVIPDNSNFESVSNNVHQMMREFSRNSFRVQVIAVPDWKSIPHDKIQTLVQACRDRYFKEDLWLLYDHPANAEIVQDFSFNHGSLLLFFIQKLSDLMKASEELEKTPYYDQWPSDYKEKVLEQRHRYYLKYLSLQVAPSSERVLK